MPRPRRNTLSHQSNPLVKMPPPIELAPVASIPQQIVSKGNERAMAPTGKEAAREGTSEPENLLGPQGKQTHIDRAVIFL
ncbi:hypothetical protein TNCV_3702551 [Trichonephila clavipes]|nr:hypothetical protein TNCV_3702551 [Trichonephila clavipes]